MVEEESDQVWTGWAGLVVWARLVGAFREEGDREEEEDADRAIHFGGYVVARAGPSGRVEEIPLPFTGWVEA